MRTQSYSRLRFIFCILYFTFFIFSCSVTQKISKSAKEIVLKDSSLLTAHIGISIYEPGENKYWYNYNGEKYFVPASNIKIPTCYAAMKYLEDSLVGVKATEYAGKIYINASADPTLLHPEFKNQPVFDFLKKVDKEIWASDYGWKDDALGSGWSWNDYSEEYMTERSALPVFGNVIRFSGKKDDFIYFPKNVSASTKFQIRSRDGAKGFIDEVRREFQTNFFTININGKELREVKVPFLTSGDLAFKLLADTLKKIIIGPNYPPAISFEPETFIKYNIHSQPTDSLLKPMMHRSDNFFAEQTLLMVSNEKLGYMNDAKIIDSILKTDFKDLPQKPRWVDGSGLSRYNLFTPQDFVAILDKMQNEFGMNRIKEIFATGGEGTISSYYKTDSGFIYAKTGTLSGVVALSGFLTTKKGKQLLFSVLVNNHLASATAVRKAVEKFIQGIRNKH